MDGSCFGPGHKYYQAASHGIDSMMERFLRVGQSNYSI